MHKFLAMMLLLGSFLTSYAQAGLVGTHEVVESASGAYTTEQLQQALSSQALQAQLTELGVDVDQLGERIASLTPAEIEQLNAELEQQPAGGIIGVLFAIFLIFVITDMLCATDIFGFVKCINK